MSRKCSECGKEFEKHEVIYEDYDCDDLLCSDCTIDYIESTEADEDYDQILDTMCDDRPKRFGFNEIDNILKIKRIK